MREKVPETTVRGDLTVRQPLGNPLGVEGHDGDGLASRRRGPTSNNDAEIDDALEGVGERSCKENRTSTSTEEAGELISVP